MIEERASAAGFGELIARVPHPNGKLYALIAGVWAAMTGMVLIVGLVAAVGSPVALISVLIFGVLTAFLGSLTFGYVRRQAFYFYAEGYLLTSPFGRVARAVSWHDVREIHIPMVVGTVVTKPRTVCEIRHKHGHGRKVRFTELHGQEVVAPLAMRLRAQATSL